VDEAHTHVDDAPAEHQGREVERGADLLDDHIGRYLEQDVRGVVGKQSDIEAAALVEVQLRSQSLDRGIADVDAVQEGHHVDDEEDGEDDQVELHDEPALGLGIDWRIGRVRARRLGRRR